MSEAESDTHLDVVVIGAGAVGLAVSLALASRGLEVGVIERHDGAGKETSSRNSGVIHAGIYYPLGSQKASLCVEGRERLYHWCEVQKVPFEKCGKLIVATNDDERSRLDAIATRGRLNGAGDLRLYDAHRISRDEPRLRACAALWSPESGIVDAEAFVQSLRREAIRRGVHFSWGREVQRCTSIQSYWRLETSAPDQKLEFVEARWVINAAGLHADGLLQNSRLAVTSRSWRHRWVKGDYYRLSRDAPRPNARLVYPVPSPDLKGLGIHLTRDLGESTLAGPDAENVDALDYALSTDKRSAFAESLRPWLPGIEAGHLSPDYSGIRPKLTATGEPPADFLIETVAPGFVHLGGIESPGLTASLAIGQKVSRLVEL